MDGGWGWLRLQTATRQIDVETIGANGHFCGVSATLAAPLPPSGTVPASTADGCRFTLASTVDGRLTLAIDEGTREACRLYCGMRAGFEGEFRRLAGECTAAALDARHKRGLAAYRAGRHAEAHGLWAPALARCAASMHWSQRWGWRNDAAIAAFHAGQKAECMRLSQAVLADARRFTQDGDDEPFGNAPTDADGARPLLQAARHNLAKCGGTPR